MMIYMHHIQYFSSILCIKSKVELINIITVNNKELYKKHHLRLVRIISLEIIESSYSIRILEKKNSKWLLHISILKLVNGLSTSNYIY